MKNLLHIGCGLQNIKSLPLLFQETSWDEIRMDIDPSVNPDIVGKLQDLSLIEDGIFDAICSSHNIEHVYSYEVEPILHQFNRILKPNGFALILCPNIQSVIEAILLEKKSFEDTLYILPAGPINALDVIYGYQSDIQKGNIFMAHKTAFDINLLIKKIMLANFNYAFVARDKFYCLHGIAFKEDWTENQIKKY